MKKLLCLFYLISVIILVSLMAGCSTTAHVATERISANTTTFIIPSTIDDPIGVAPLISEEISKRGFMVKIVYPHQGASNQESKPGASFGSGFFISENGLLITNAHIVKGSSSIFIRKVDGKKFMAKVLVTDVKNDIAILKPSESILLSKWLSLGQFKSSKLGDALKIVGFPLSDLLGKHPRVNEGIISADVGLMDDPTHFQFSASTQPGNSGGPILNEKFQVIGVVTSKISDAYAIKKTGSIPQNINFGVKIDYARMLFNNDIEKSVKAKTSKIDSLEDAIDATALIAVNVSDIPESISLPEKRKAIIITFNYSYYWDVFHYSLKRFNMQWIEKDTGEIIANGNFSGQSFRSYKGIVKKVLEEVFTKVRIK